MEGFTAKLNHVIGKAHYCVRAATKAVSIKWAVLEDGLDRPPYYPQKGLVKVRGATVRKLLLPS